MPITDCGCMQDPQKHFSLSSRVCNHCPWFLVAGALAGHDFGLKRQEFMRRIIESGHTGNDRVIVRAIAMQYNTNMTAAALSFRRARRSWRLAQRESG